MNKYTEQQQVIRSRSDRNLFSSLSCLWHWSREDTWIQKPQQATLQLAYFLFVMRLQSNNCCLLSPVLWKMVNNLPHSLLTYHRDFQDKAPSAIHHSSHTSFSVTLHFSVPFVVLLCPFWCGRTRTVHSVQDVDALLWACTVGTRCFTVARVDYRWAVIFTGCILSPEYHSCRQQLSSSESINA